MFAVGCGQNSISGGQRASDQTRTQTEPEQNSPSSNGAPPSPTGPQAPSPMDSNPPAEVDPTPPPESAECDILQSTSGWSTMRLQRQEQSFQMVAEITVDRAPFDAIVALSPNQGQAFSDYAALVRLNVDGRVDAMNGSRYVAEEAFSYQANTRYLLEIAVDVTAKRYSAVLKDPTGGEILVADDYSFRDEQGSAQFIENLGLYSEGGTLSLCTLQFEAAESSPPPVMDPEDPPPVTDPEDPPPVTDPEDPAPIFVEYGSEGAGLSRTSDCDVMVDSGAMLSSAVEAARSGDVLCVQGGSRAGETVRINKAVTLRAIAPTTIQNAVLSGQGATLEGFLVQSTNASGASYGIEFSGSGHTIRDNKVQGRGLSVGIGCDDCGSDHLIANNTITDLNNIGIVLYNGQNIVVEYNNIYDLWKSSGNGDVDGMRFWGIGHTIRHNYIHDINEFKSEQAGGGNPHVDCWQNWKRGVQTRDVLIENNFCVRVSRQCMISRNHTPGVEIRDITFRGNVCETYDSSVMNVTVPGLVLENNLFLGGVKHQVLGIYDEADNDVVSSVTLRNNIVIKAKSQAAHFFNGVREGDLASAQSNLYLLDESIASRDNAFSVRTDQSYPSLVENDFVYYQEVALQAMSVDSGSTGDSSFIRDINGQARVKGGGVDIGPFEHR